MDREREYTKPLLDKLGVKPGHVVAVLGIQDREFRDQLERRGAVVSPRLRAELDAVFFGAERKNELSRLRTLATFIKPDGAVWVVNPKGVAVIREADVLAAGKPAGLVDVKVVRFSETHTAHKFVIPRDKRKARR